MEDAKDWKINKKTAAIKAAVPEGIALSIRKNDDGKWELVEIEYNVVAGTSNIVKVTTLLEHKGSAINAYLIRSMNLRHSIP